VGARHALGPVAGLPRSPMKPPSAALPVPSSWNNQKNGPCSEAAICLLKLSPRYAMILSSCSAQAPEHDQFSPKPATS
jgi:hypothetical protein